MLCNSDSELTLVHGGGGGVLVPRPELTKHDTQKLSCV